MAYFNRKDIVRILAEKPDMMSDFPACVMNVRQREDMQHIPKIMLCDITMMEEYGAAVGRICGSVNRPDAVLPAVIYSGIEQARWSCFDSVVETLRKKTAGFLNVHMLPPVVLGAPLFRRALCGYAGMHTHQHARGALECAACLFYRAAVCIPLCKQCGITTIYLTALAPGCAHAVQVLHPHGFLKYCRILPAGYGISLDVVPPGSPMPAPGAPDSPGASFECCARLPDALRDSASVTDNDLQGYFEKFAIPFAANVISGVLSGRCMDFLDTARAFSLSGARHRTRKSR